MAKYGGPQERLIELSIDVKLTPRPRVIESEAVIRFTAQMIENLKERDEFLSLALKRRNELLLNTKAADLVIEKAQFRVWGWGESENVRESCIVTRQLGPGNTTRQLDRMKWRSLQLRRLLKSWTVEVVDKEGRDVPLELVPVVEYTGATQLSERYYNLITGLSDLAPVIDGFLVELDRALSGEEEGLGEA